MLLGVLVSRVRAAFLLSTTLMTRLAAAIFTLRKVPVRVQ